MIRLDYIISVLHKINILRKREKKRERYSLLVISHREKSELQHKKEVVSDFQNVKLRLEIAD